MRSDGGVAAETRGAGRFEIQHELGSGGMGVVYQALDHERNVRVALKTLRRLDAQALYRFKQEFRALQGLQHPNLVGFGELIEEKGQWFFTMELVEGEDFIRYTRPDGGSLDAERNRAPTQPGPVLDPRTWVNVPTDQLSRQIRFDEKRLRDSLAQLALGIEALHTSEKVHRDIKPTNIRITPGGRVVLLDFGLITETSGLRESTEMSVVGTAAYMAPEQAASKAVGPAADWYSMGVVMYEALTGRLPYTGTAMQICLDKQSYEPVPPRAHIPEIPTDLDSLCVELLRFDPRARPRGQQILKRLGAVEAAYTARGSTSEFSRIGVFLGRDREMARLREAFEATRKGRAVCMLVHGESGIGKSELIRRFAETVTGDQGAVILAGRCYERESVPYKAFDGVVDSLSRHMRRLPQAEASALLPRHASLLPQVFPVLGRVKVIARAPVPRKEVQDPLELRRLVFAALRELLSRLAERRPLMVVIDDIQWADNDSQRLLGDLMRQPEAPPMLLVIASRVGPDEKDGAAAGIVETLGDDVQVVPIEALASDPAEQLARALLNRSKIGLGVDPKDIADEARGHPLFIDELARHVAVSGGEKRPLLRLDEAIWARVGQLHPRAIEFIELVSVAGEPVAQEIIAEAAEMSPSQFSRHLAVLRVGHIIRGGGGRASDRVEPYHDRIREAVLSHLKPQRRLELHNQLAMALETSRVAAEQPELLLRHLEAAGQTDKGARYAQQAARRSFKALAFDRAAELYRTALRLGNYDESRTRTLKMSLGDALSHAGRGAEAADTYMEAARGADPRARLECHRKAAEFFLATGYIEKGLDVLNDVLADVGVRLPRSPRSAVLSLLWRRLKLRLRGYWWRERHESRISAHDLTLSDVYRTATTTLAMVDTVTARHFQTCCLLHDLKLGERNRTLESLLHEVSFLGAPGARSIPRARKLFARTAPAVRATGDPKLIAVGLIAEGILNYFDSRFTKAERRFKKAEVIFIDSSIGDWAQLNVLRSFRLINLRHMGEFEKLGELFGDYLRGAERRGDRYAETTLKRVCNLIWLVRGRPREARRHLDSASWVAPGKSFHLQHYWELLARIELALYEGTLTDELSDYSERMRDMERSLLLRAVQVVRAEHQWTQGRILLATGGSAKEVLARAKKIQRERTGYSEVWSGLLRAAVASQQGDRDAVADLLRRVIKSAEKHAMGLCAASARRRLGVLLGGEQGTAEIARCQAWTSAAGVVDPIRMIEVVAPGFRL